MGVEAGGQTIVVGCQCWLYEMRFLFISGSSSAVWGRKAIIAAYLFGPIQTQITSGQRQEPQSGPNSREQRQ